MTKRRSEGLDHDIHVEDELSREAGGSGLGAKGSRVHEDEEESIRKEVCLLPGTKGIEEMVVVGVESDLLDLVEDDQVEEDDGLAPLCGDEDLRFLLDDEGKILDLDAFLDERDDDL